MVDSTTRRVFVAGHAGMLGAAIVRKLQKRKNVVIITDAKRELDLRDQSAVRAFFEINIIDDVYINLGTPTLLKNFIFWNNLFNKSR